MGWNGRIDSGWVIYCVDTFRTMPSCIASPPLLTMRPTNSALNNSVGATLEAASFLLSAMCDANSSPHNVFGTSSKAASFTRNLCSMCDTDSFFLGMVVAILEATTFDHCSMCDIQTPPITQHHCYIPSKVHCLRVTLALCVIQNSSLNDVFGTHPSKLRTV